MRKIIGIMFLVLASLFVSCSDSADDKENGGNGGGSALKEFSAGWWKYESAGVQAWILYESDKTISRVGSATAEYASSSSSFTSARSLYKFDSEEVNKNLTKVTDESVLPSWAKTSSEKVELYFGRRMFSQFHSTPSFSETYSGSNVFDFSVVIDNNSLNWFNLDIKSKNKSVLEQDVLDRTVVTSEVLNGNTNCIYCADYNEQHKDSYTGVLNSSLRWDEDLKEYSLKRCCFLDYDKLAAGESVKVRVTYSHPNMEKDLVVNMTFTKVSE